MRAPKPTLAVALLFLAALFAGLSSPAHAQRGACPDPTINGLCTPVSASASGSTGAITATLPAVAYKLAYICGLTFTGTNATAANTATSVTVTGTITGTLNFGFPTLAAAATVPNTPPLIVPFSPCVAASGINTAIAVNGPALGAGSTLTTVSAWGYYL
jgi:hypothetical protein